MAKISDEELEVELKAIVDRLNNFLSRHGRDQEAANRVMDILCNSTFNILVCLDVPIDEYLTTFGEMYKVMYSKLVSQQVEEIIAAPKKEGANADQG